MTKLILVAALMAPCIALSAEKVVLLDGFYHHELRKGIPYHYTWDDTALSGFSKLGGVFRQHGARLETLSKAPTEEYLRGCSVYIIVNPDNEKKAPDHKPNYMDAAAADVIVNWVQAGGVLVLMNNDKGNADFEHINLLASRFGITFNEDLRNETTNGDLKKARVMTEGFGTHPLFRDVRAIYMKQICTLTLKDPAKAILTADKESGTATDVLMATSQSGKGLVFAVGDPWLYNEYIDFAPKDLMIENRKAANNLVTWVLEATNQTDMKGKP